MKKRVEIVLISTLLIFSFLFNSKMEFAKLKKPVLSKKNLVMRVGESKVIKVKYTKKKVKWSSNKKQIASVSQKGKIKAKKKGKVIITAKVGGERLKCRVTVNRKKIMILKMLFQRKVCRLMNQ